MAIDVYEIPKRLTKPEYERLTSEQLEVVRRRLHQREADDDFNSVEAAIYTGVSVRTIKRAIDAGKGPERGKTPNTTGSNAVNQHTRYRKVDLDAWRANNRSFDTFTGAFNAFDDLVVDEPWIMAGNRVVGHLFDVGDIDDLMAILASGEVEFLRLDEALRERWIDISLRSSYRAKLASIMETTLADVQSAADRDALDVENAGVSRDSERRGL
ncbi:hypothetical protein N792_03960 [Lysobacter concretionis Ko07 = DSM 16239]|uniref:Helix-turn-helix domain-containing protein n=1 Tax=Lysobacter concretionis Ko07 = DSM 16239 TaxID=1122185 RepID=A0A0A0EPY1_9GAMM|nr:MULTISPECIES: helix-turn-helix domain-containing protein [Lysobacter]KGM52275.1 hypothetical protein N792_03960 [Lysobacter concretionis Ko07 = DSM 16239]QOD91992.1 helix-turn-helix domain-containing protein [Lysobacter sp. CW239]